MSIVSHLSDPGTKKTEEEMGTAAERKGMLHTSAECDFYESFFFFFFKKPYQDALCMCLQERHIHEVREFTQISNLEFTDKVV